MKTDLYNLKNEKVGTVEVPEKIFGVKWNPVLVHQVLRAHLANKRVPWAHAKTRAEVRGGGRKPWRQKGTGRARHGSIRSPLWVGGGKAHGPSKERDYSQKVNKKMGRLALFSALSKKLSDGEVKFFENFSVEAPKTKLLAGALKTVLNLKKNQKKYDTLILADKENKNIFRASRNLPKMKSVSVDNLNLYDILNFKRFFIENEALRAMVKHFKVGV